MKKPTIKQQILDHLKSGKSISYGMANTMTNSQSGYRRLQEILAESPKEYQFIKVKSQHGSMFNVFAKKGCFKTSQDGPNEHKVLGLMIDDGWYKRWFHTESFETHKEAEAHIKKVVR